MPNARAERPLAGILLRLGSASCYVGMTTMLKLAAGREPVAALEMLFYRTLFGLPVVLAWVLAGPGLGALATRRPWAHAGRSALGFTSILLTFQGLILLPLELAIVIGFTAPIFATLLSAVLLGEAVGPRRWAAVALGFAGIVVATNPGTGTLPALGVAVAIASALGQGSVTVTLRQIGRTEHPAAIVFWFFTASIIAAGAAMPFVGRVHGPATLALLAGGGVLGGAMQLMMTASLRHAPVAVLAPFDYSQIMWALLLGWAVWGDAPMWTTLAGAALIAGSGLYTAWREHRLRRVPAEPVPVE